MTKKADLLNADVAQDAEPQEGAPDVTSQETVGQTVGSLLRAAREVQGIDVGILASGLKVSVHKLELLEQDQYDALPSVAFTRNLAISVARRLKVDEKLVTELLPELDNLAMINAVIKLTHGSAHGAVMKEEVLTGKKRSGFWWLLLIGLIVILLALIFLLPKWGSGYASGEVSSGDGVSTPVQVIPMRMQSLPNVGGVASDVVSVVSVSGSIEAESQQSEQGSDADSVNDANSAGGAAQEVALPAQGEQSSPVSPEPDGESVAVSVPMPDGMLEISTQTESWLKVAAVSGEVLHESILKEDAVYSLLLVPEDLPLSIRLGRATDAVVTVRGVVFNLSSYVVGDVADFKVE